MFKKIFAISIVAILICCETACTADPTPSGSITSDDIAGIIEQYRPEIVQRMQQEHIPGLAIAVVDDQGILWSEGFGYTDWDQQTPVTTSTLFAIQSMSKSFTATAVMFAAQDGLVDLDEPITTYLPDFTVHSIFEDHPEQKMTLRILLSHTAGFPHDASYGNNQYFPAVFSFEKHIASISDTWLLFPVGTRYSYSSEDTDLAGYILQVRSGMPFIQYVQQKVLDPLGMKDSTLDYLKVRATATRAVGHGGDPLSLRPPVDLLMIPAGGVWTTAEDMARYLQFHINEGALDGKRLLQENLAETMYTPPNPAASDAGYALGVYPETRNGTRYLQHGGGGFGTTNYMAWYPDLKLGGVVLSNATTPGAYAVSLCENVLDSIIKSNISLYHQRFESAARPSPAYPPDTKSSILFNPALRDLIESKTLPMDAAALQRRSAYAGKYILSSRGFPSDLFLITFSNDMLAYVHQGGESKVNESGTLTEVQPGFLVSEYGNTFDLRGPVLLIDNYRVVKASTQLFLVKILFYAICGFLFLYTLVAWPVRSLIRRLSKNKGQAQTADEGLRGKPWQVLIRMLAVLVSLFSLFCLMIVALMPDLVYFPWPKAWLELLWWQTAIFWLPFICFVLAIFIAVLAILNMRINAARRATNIYYLIVALAALIFNLVVVV